jgi:hypothetical protein
MRCSCPPNLNGRESTHVGRRRSRRESPRWSSWQSATRTALGRREFLAEQAEREMDKRPGAPMTTGLHGALQRDDGKMPTPAEIAELEREAGLLAGRESEPVVRRSASAGANVDAARSGVPGRLVGDGSRSRRGSLRRTESGAGSRCTRRRTAPASSA